MQFDTTESRGGIICAIDYASRKGPPNLDWPIQEACAEDWTCQASTRSTSRANPYLNRCAWVDESRVTKKLALDVTERLAQFRGGNDD